MKKSEINLSEWKFLSNMGDHDLMVSLDDEHEFILYPHQNIVDQSVRWTYEDEPKWIYSTLEEMDATDDGDELESLKTYIERDGFGLW